MESEGPQQLASVPQDYMAHHAMLSYPAPLPMTTVDEVIDCTNVNVFFFFIIFFVCLFVCLFLSLLFPPSLDRCVFLLALGTV